MKKKQVYLFILMAIIVVFASYGLLQANSQEIDEKSKEEELAQDILSNDEEIIEEANFLNSSDDSMEKIAENSSLIMYFNYNTAVIAIGSKKTGDLWYSNPMEVEKDPKASKATKEQMKSQLSLSYYNQADEGKTIHSYNEAIVNNQLTAEKVTDGIQLEYRIGREEQRNLLPIIIIKERFEDEILNNLTSSRVIGKLETFYRFYSLKDAANDEIRLGWLKEYPILESKDIYVFRGGTEREIREIEGFIKEAGYTYDMLEEDHELTGFTDEDTKYPFFKIIMEYRLEEDSLVVSIPVKEIEYDKESFNLYKLEVLKYFAAGENGEDGYLFIPDGSGAIINFNNDGRKSILSTSGKVYGEDYSITQNNDTNNKGSYHIPVYGIKEGNKAILAIIEEGDAIAEITSEVGNIINSYNTVYPTFTITQKDNFSFGDVGGGGTSWNAFSNNPYEGKITLRYKFLWGDKVGYVEMAKAYQDYLVEKNILDKSPKKEDIPLYLETLGSFKTLKRVLGIPVVKSEPLTSFEEAKEMVDHLLSKDISNIVVRYKGWFNGGLDYSAPTKIKIEASLGGKSAFNKLGSFMEDNELALYPDVDLVFIRRNTFFDGFVPMFHGVRTLDKTIGGYRQVDLATHFKAENSLIYSISPSKTWDYYGKFMNHYKGYSMGNISFASYGQYINSEFRKGKEINRQESKDIILGTLKDAKDRGYSITVDGGNAYVYPYVDHILNMPLSSSRTNISDEDVPFMQILLHGYIQYAGSPINTSVDSRVALLKSLEFGSNPYYLFTYKNSSDLKDTAHSQYYSTNYYVWIEEAINMYEKINQILKSVQNETIENHEKLDEHVYKTTYSNGLEIVVNYSEETIRYKGSVIDSLDYAVFS